MSRRPTGHGLGANRELEEPLAGDREDPDDGDDDDPAQLRPAAGPGAPPEPEVDEVAEAWQWLRGNPHQATRRARAGPVAARSSADRAGSGAVGSAWTAPTATQSKLTKGGEHAEHQAPAVVPDLGCSDGQQQPAAGGGRIDVGPVEALGARPGRQTPKRNSQRPRVPPYSAGQTRRL